MRRYTTLTLEKFIEAGGILARSERPSGVRKNPHIRYPSDRRKRRTPSEGYSRYDSERN